MLSAPVARASGRAGCCHGALVIKPPLRNGQENGLRSRGLVHPEHALYLAELSPDKIGRATDAEDEQVMKERLCSCMVTLFLRLEMVDGVGVEPTFADLQPAVGPLY